MTRKEKSYLTKQRIIQTALNLASEKNYNDVKVTDICTASGTSIGSFYHYFSSKEDVFLASRDVFSTWIQKRMNAREYHNYFEKLNSIINLFLLNAEISSLGGIQVYYSLRLSNTKTSNTADSPTTPYFIQVIRECLENGIIEHEFKLTLTLEDSIGLIVCTLRGIVINWALDNGSFDIMDVGCKHMRNLLTVLIEDL